MYTERRIFKYEARLATGTYSRLPDLGNESELQEGKSYKAAHLSRPITHLHDTRVFDLCDTSVLDLCDTSVLDLPDTSVKVIFIEHIRDPIASLLGFPISKAVLS